VSGTRRSNAFPKVSATNTLSSDMLRTLGDPAPGTTVIPFCVNPKIRRFSSSTVSAPLPMTRTPWIPVLVPIAASRAGAVDAQVAQHDPLLRVVGVRGDVDVHAGGRAREDRCVVAVAVDRDRVADVQRACAARTWTPPSSTPFLPLAPDLHAECFADDAVAEPAELHTGIAAA
jgi:hypothetical protein